MKNAVVWPETARVAIMQSPLNPAGEAYLTLSARQGANYAKKAAL